ncbi:hypothetical protein J7L60_03730 [Candidatus Bathyarchaeota archaeon]|nr:hypothetical protein [Candidatus Bathyarchaeota archaeon]
MRRRGSEVSIGELRRGDAIRVHWLDASEVTSRLPEGEHLYDTPIRSYGVFLGVKGRRTKHLVIAKEVITHERTFHYNVIPLGMVEKVILLNPSDLDENLLRHLSKKVRETPVKKFKVGWRGGWMRWV